MVGLFCCMRKRVTMSYFRNDNKPTLSKRPVTALFPQAV